MLAQGKWEQALDEATRGSTDGVLNRRASSAALYVQGELHRLRGEFEAAEAAYRLATRSGGTAQPGLALVRLAQGNLDDALASIRRVADENAPPLDRARFLPALVEIGLANGELEEAAHASNELAAVARTLESGWVAQGPAVAEFEAKVAAFTGAAHAVATSSGTTALHAALAALGAGPGDDFLTREDKNPNTAGVKLAARAFGVELKSIDAVDSVKALPIGGRRGLSLSFSTDWSPCHDP
jgi:tetratricopeptide (TPR) repeat protein